MLVFILVFFIFISLVTNTLTFSDIKDTFIENIVTFIFVGVIEFWFFTNVASKFIPAPPSILFTSLLNSLKKYLDSRIIDQ